MLAIKTYIIISNVFGLRDRSRRQHLSINITYIGQGARQADGIGCHSLLIITY